MNATRTTGARRRTTRTTRTSSTRRRSPRWYPTRRRRRPGLSSTIGSALGMLAVTTLLNLSWPARIGLLVLVLVVGLGYMLWRNRGEIVAAGEAAAQDDGATEADGIPDDDPAPPTPQDRPAAPAPEAPTS